MTIAEIATTGEGKSAGLAMTLRSDVIARNGAEAYGGVAIDVMLTCFSGFGADRPGIYPWAGEFKCGPPPNLPHFEGENGGGVTSSIHQVPPPAVCTNLAMTLTG